LEEIIVLGLNFDRALCLAALAACLFGCSTTTVGLVGSGGAGGATSNSGGSAGSGAGGGAGGASGAPTIVKVTPADRASGVAKDVNVVIQFDRPMSKAATQAAFQSTALLPAVFTWNTDGSELTVNPNQDLSYATGIGNTAVTALSYSFTLTTAARDAQGAALAADATVTFTTSRQLSTTLPDPEGTATGALTGYVIEDLQSNPSNYVDPCAGDALDVKEYGFATFDLAPLPSDAESVVSARLTATVLNVTGTPFDMGPLHVEDVAYDSLNTAFTASLSGDLGDLLYMATDLTGSLDVGAAVQADFAQRATNGNHTQFRFAFLLPVSNNGVTDDVCLNPLKLDVSYLAP
jgi:hypothetical protein